MPVRWGRIIAAVVVLVVAVASLVAVQVRTSGDGRSHQRNAQRGPAAPHAPTSVDEQPDVLSASVVSPRPGASPGTPADLATPPAPVAPGDPGLTDPEQASAPAGGRSGASRPTGAATMSVAPRPAGAVLGLSTTSIDLGDVDSVWRVDMRAQGTSPVDVVIGASPSWLTVAPDRSRVEPGADVPLVFTLDRAGAPPGAIDVTVPVSARDGRGGGNVRVRATVNGAPQITSVHAAPARIYPGGCPPGNGPTVATVTVSVVDPTGIFGVRLAANLPDGRESTVTLSLASAEGNRSNWSGTLGPAAGAGTVTYTVTATDLDGRHSETQGTLVVLACPS